MTELTIDKLESVSGGAAITPVQITPVEIAPVAIPPVGICPVQPSESFDI